MNILHRPSPNFNDRPIDKEGMIDTIIIHYTAMPCDTSLDRLCDKSAQVSAHYLIDEDGSLYQMVADNKRAWHAGVSYWQGRDNVNDNSIGIELVNLGHEYGYTDFPTEQIAVLCELLGRLTARYDVVASKIVGHSDIAPGRKIDPGEKFPWAHLARQGFGLYPQVSAADEMALICDVDRMIAAKKHLIAIGYGISDHEAKVFEMEKTLRAFQMHWRPKCCHGKLDHGTEKMLQAVAGEVVNLL